MAPFYQKYLPVFYEELQKERIRRAPEKYGTGLVPMLIEHARKKLAKTSA